MPDATAGAQAGMAINLASTGALPFAVGFFKEQLGDNFLYILIASIGLILCVYPPTIATYVNLQGNSYSYENYILQVFLPMAIGFALFLGIVFFDLLKDFGSYYEQLIIYLGCASILSSSLAITFILYRMKYHGT
jgi:hypothetical protein